MRIHHHHGPALSVDDAAGTDRGMRVIVRSFAGLLFTAAVQALVVAYTGSVALLADTIHNAGDAATALPLWIAFRYARRKPDGRFTYGYGRLEDLAGVIVVAMILASAVAAGWEAVQRLTRPAAVPHLWAVAAASVIGFLGNEAVAAYRIRAGRAIGSAALVADGEHARADGLTSLAVLAGVAGVFLGYPVADPGVGLFITAMLLRIVWTSGREVFLRLLDGVDASVVGQIRETALEAPAVREVTDVRVRWSGHRMYAEVNAAVDPRLSVSAGHAAATDVRHRLLHRLPFLTDATVHIDPLDASGSARHGSDAHEHDGFPGHSHS